MRRGPGPDLFDVSSLLVSRRTGPERVTRMERRLVWRDRMRRGSWTRMDVGYILALFVIVLLNLLDIVITLIGTSARGWEIEGNPVIRVVAQTAGEAVVVVFKLTLVAVALSIIWYLYRRTQLAMAAARTRDQYNQARGVRLVIAGGTFCLLLFYVWVIQNNVRIVWG